MHAIVEFPMPETYTEVRAFCGLVGHYCCFIRNFAHLAHVLYDLLGDEVKMGLVTLTPKEEEAVSYWKLMPSRKGLEWYFYRNKMMDATTP